MYTQCWIRDVGCLKPLSTIFLWYCGGQYYLWRKPSICHSELTNFSQDVLLSTCHHKWLLISQTLVKIGIFVICTRVSNYHTITVKSAPCLKREIINHVDILSQISRIYFCFCSHHFIWISSYILLVF